MNKYKKGIGILVLGLPVLFLFSVVPSSNRKPASEELIRLALNGEMKKVSEIKKLFKRPDVIPHPFTNPYSVEKAELGKKLFFDPRLSGGNEIACVTCHSPAKSWSDGLPRAVGHTKVPLGRRTPPLWNAAWNFPFFWDGRARSLEEQATGPITAPGEMNQDMDELLLELKRIPGYVAEFERVFPKTGITEENLAKSIATFERTIISHETPFDRWVEGDEAAISPSAIEGFKLFVSSAQCVRCHSGWNFRGYSLNDIGLKGDDRGMGEFHPGNPVLQYRFKVPSLRNVAERPFFMHDGSITNLEEVVEIYVRGGDVKRPSLDEFISPLTLTALEKKALVDFMKSLTSTEPLVEAPILPTDMASK